MVLENEAAAPKHIPQLRHLIFQEEQKDKTYAGNNIADEIDNLDPMLETHEFVQKIEKSKGPTGQVPAIILYSENQMKDFEMSVKNTDNPRVCIDRTFNLGCFFVTSIVYKNTRVVRRETNDHPIFLGPILLHKDAGCDTYHYFLSHISARLSSTVNNVDVILPLGIHIGSDDQKALTKAIDSVFSTSKTYL